MKDNSPQEISSFSLLLSLPRELRDRVYKYALVLDRPVCWPNPPFPKSDNGHGLLTTSRQVYEEAAPILYSKNKFLFSHPSDITMFRVVASQKYSEGITCAYLRITDKNLRLWTTYLGSRRQERCLKNDLPKLKHLWIYLSRGPHIGPNEVTLAQQGNRNFASQILAVHHAIRHHFAMQTALQADNAAANTQQPGTSPTPSSSSSVDVMDLAEPLYRHYFGMAEGQVLRDHPHPLPYAALPPAQLMAPHIFPGAPGAHHTHPAHRQRGPLDYLVTRWEREIGLEALCLALRETRPADAQVRVVCVLRLPKTELLLLCDAYPKELTMGPEGNARTRFRKLLGLEVGLELTGFSVGRRSQRLPTPAPADELLDRLSQGIGLD